MNICSRVDYLEKKVTRIEYILYYIAGVVSMTGLGRMFTLFTGGLN